MPIVYIIDASSYVYRAFFALPPLTSPAGMPTNAVFGLATMLLKLLKSTQPEYIVAVFDAPGATFRDELFEGYKANRQAMPGDLAVQVPFVREIVDAFRIRSLTLNGVEADDVIATLVEKLRASESEVVVITGDKDLMQIVRPGVKLWDTMRDRWIDTKAVQARFGVSPEQVVDLLGLMGDSVDNIPGVEGIGEKTATLLVQRFGSIDNLLDRLDDLATMADIRGAKKLAERLRASATIARLSRDLARVRSDVDLQVGVDDLRYPGPDPAALRAIFTRLGFQKLVRETVSSSAPLQVTPSQLHGEHELQALAAAGEQAHQLVFACHQDQEGFTAAVLGATPTPVWIDLKDRVPEPLARLLEDETVEKLGHDIKIDLRILRQCVPQVARSFDVMVASYLLEASATHRLEDLSSDVLGINLPAFRGNLEGLASGLSILPQLREALAPRLLELGLGRLFSEVEMPLVGVLASMEERGVRIDVAALAQMSRDLEARMSALEESIYELAGGQFNIASPPQLREVLFERLKLSTRGVRRGKTGLSTDVDVLTRLASVHPLPAKILDYRGLAKLKSTYVDALPAAVNPRTGRLHTTFNQTVAATGRLSSSDPNLQNIPIRGADGRRVRASFIADVGCLLVVADYSQIELRVLAHLSEDPLLIAAFQTGEDIHTRTASEVFAVLPGAVTRDMRRAAKVINFGIIYGMGAQALARELAVPVAQAEDYITSYFQRYAGVRAYLDAIRQTAREQGYVTTILGRRRTLPDLASPERGVAQAAERTAANTPIQGSAADLIKLAMVAIDRRLRHEEVRGGMILQVHDELILEVPVTDVERTQTIVRHEMEGVLPLKVPLKVDMGIGPTWADAH